MSVNMSDPKASEHQWVVCIEQAFVKQMARVQCKWLRMKCHRTTFLSFTYIIPYKSKQHQIYLIRNKEAAFSPAYQQRSTLDFSPLRQSESIGYKVKKNDATFETTKIVDRHSIIVDLDCNITTQKKSSMNSIIHVK